MNKAEEDVWFAMVRVEANSRRAYAHAAPCSSRTHRSAFHYTLSYSNGERVRGYKSCGKQFGNTHQNDIHRYSLSQQFLWGIHPVQDSECTRLCNSVLVMTAGDGEWAAMGLGMTQPHKMEFYVAGKQNKGDYAVLTWTILEMHAKWTKPGTKQSINTLHLGKKH